MFLGLPVDSLNESQKECNIDDTKKTKYVECIILLCLKGKFNIMLRTVTGHLMNQIWFFW